MWTPGSTGHLHGDPPPGGSHIIGLVQPGCGWGHGPVTRRPPGFTLDQGAPSSWVPAQTTQESWGHSSAWLDLDGTVLACLSSPHVWRQGFGACVLSRGSAGLDGTGQGTWWPRGAALRVTRFPSSPTGREAREVRGACPAGSCPGAPRPAPPRLSCVFPAGRGRPGVLGGAFPRLLDLQDGWVGLHDGHDDPVDVVLQPEIDLFLLLNGVHELISGD